MKLLLLASAATLAVASAPVVQPGMALPAARLPGFAADLAQSPSISGPSAWQPISEADAWRALARASQYGRQPARWNYARSLIAAARGAEAIGVLDVMRQDDPDLAMVDAYRVARGAALVLLSRPAEALAQLDSGALATNGEACAWRLRALAEAGMAEQALAQLGCARSAIGARAPFIIAAARAAVDAGQPALAAQWLRPLPDRDPGANLYRGRVETALGHPAEARLRFARVEAGGAVPLQMDARLGEIEAALAAGTIRPAIARRQLEALRYRWRGDQVEERALRLSYRLSNEAGDVAGALNAGATLFRFHDPARQGADFTAGLQAQLAVLLDPARNMPLVQAAGLFWDYRDLLPGGAEGDLLVSRLADRLQGAGLYGRAADLLEHQLFVRAQGLAQGPLSVKVATLDILAGRPDRALAALRKSDGNAYPDAMLFARKRVEAVALSQIGKSAEAAALLQDVPDGQALRAEIYWKNRDWPGVAAATQDSLPRAKKLSEVQQATVLRHAIALAMLGREDGLAALHGRYAAAFAGLKTAPVFDMLTAAPGSAHPEAVARAMASLPNASPAGDMADLIETAPPIGAKGRAGA